MKDLYDLQVKLTILLESANDKCLQNMLNWDCSTYNFYSGQCDAYRKIIKEIDHLLTKSKNAYII